MPYWIKHKIEELYWHEKNGWVEPDIDLMTNYSDARQKATTLPPDGWWEQQTHTLTYDLLFSVTGATDESGKKVTGEQLRAGVMACIEKLDREGWSKRSVIGPINSNPEN